MSTLLKSLICGFFLLSAGFLHAEDVVNIRDMDTKTCWKILEGDCPKTIIEITGNEKISDE